MGYEITFQKAWASLEALAKGTKFRISFLADKYEVDLQEKRVLSLSCNVATPEHLSILILHYLIKKLQGLPEINGEWITFNQLLGGVAYYPAFRKRAIDPIIRKYGKQPSAILLSSQRLGAKKIQFADCAVVLEAFENVLVMVTVSGQDEELPAEANMLFDSSISAVFTTEDVAVLSGIVAKSL